MHDHAILDHDAHEKIPFSRSLSSEYVTYPIPTINFIKDFPKESYYDLTKKCIPHKQ